MKRGYWSSHTSRTSAVGTKTSAPPVNNQRVLVAPRPAETREAGKNQAD